MDDETYAKSRGYGAFLSRYDWDWFGHLTFRWSPTKDQALRYLNTWLNKLNRRVFGKNYAKRGQGVQWVRGMERQKTGAWHFHVLIAGCADIHTDVGVSDWKKLAGNAKIQVYDPTNGGATYYLAEAYADAGDGALDYGGRWPQLDLAELRQLSAMH